MRKRNVLAAVLWVGAAGVLVLALLRGWLWLSPVVAALILAALVVEVRDD